MRGPSSPLLTRYDRRMHDLPEKSDDPLEHEEAMALKVFLRDRISKWQVRAGLPPLFAYYYCNSQHLIT